MELHTLFLVLFYSFAVCFKVYEVVHAIDQRRQERKVAEIVQNLDERLKNRNALDKSVD